MKRNFDYKKTIQERIDELSNRPLDIKYNPDGSCEIDSKKFEKVLSELNTLGSALRFNQDPLNLKDGDVYVDPQTKKIYVIQNGDKVEIENEPVDVSPYMIVGNPNPTGNDWLAKRWNTTTPDYQAYNKADIDSVLFDIDDSVTNTPIRVKTIFNDPMRCSTTILYTDGTREDYSEIKYPEVRQVKVGMSPAQVQNILSGGSSSSQSKAASRAHVGAASQNSKSKQPWNTASTKAPWDDPLDWPDEPSIKLKTIIEDAVDILRRHKGMNIPKLNISMDHCKDGIAYRVVYSVLSGPYGPDVSKGTLIELIFSHRAFRRKLRNYNPVDREAGLKPTMDTDTYVKLRIAYLLFELARKNDRDALNMSNEIMTVLGHTTKPIFTFWDK